MRIWIISIALSYFLGILALSAFNPRNYSHLQVEFQKDDEEQEIEYIENPERPVSFLRSLYILKHGYFYPLFIAYFAGVGSSILIVTKGANLWKSINTNKNWNNWASEILVAFSFLNAGFNTIMAIVADILQRKKWMKSTTLLIISVLVFAVNFLLIGLIEILKIKSNAVMILLAGCMAFAGAGGSKLKFIIIILIF
jgi:hypothetical protein